MKTLAILAQPDEAGGIFPSGVSRVYLVFATGAGNRP
jgi:hypothetical protein